MRQARCAEDGARRTTKMASVYWSYRPDGGERSAWKQFYCAEHYAPIHRLIRDNADGSIDCNACGQAAISDDAWHMIWCTVFPPGGERVDTYYQLCENCIEDALRQTHTYSQPLADRGEITRNGEPQVHADPWEAWR